ncbi:carotenoid phi-ring synthase-like [Ptychodera flava]|uniref:carotenoid phi-ring synthase-like n=1 Tax=Ptychodera flava TaxID=63121 RepID=UPI00396A81FA
MPGDETGLSPLQTNGRGLKNSVLRISSVVAIGGVILAIIIDGLTSTQRTIPPANPDDPVRLPSGVTRRVLVAGAGLAGLSAALELAERGYEVTIRESSDVVGGRLFAKPVVRLNRTFPVEHGFHAWFHNYHTFKDIRRRLDIDDNFKTWEAVDYVFKKYKPESIYSQGPYPLNLFGIVLRSPNFKFLDILIPGNILALPDMIWFNHDTVYEQYDNMTFVEWAKESRIDPKFFDILLKPALSVSLNEQQTMSAAEMLMYIQMYFLSDAKADSREVTTKNYHTAVLEPWLKKLASYGTKIETKTPIRSLVFNATNGHVIGEDGHPEEHFDHVVLATDLEGVQSIMGSTLTKYKSGDSIHNSLSKFVEKTSRLSIAPPYKVLRVWFDKQLKNAPSILETPEFFPINLIVQYHMLEEEFAEWANETGGSVLEFHLYTWEYGQVSDEEVWDIISPTVKVIYPEIFDRQFKTLAYHVHSFQNFPSFQAGLHIHRPKSTFAAECGIENLALAGDWLHTDYPSALMERAVSTGREAANQILLLDHIRQVPLTVTSSYGPGLL